MYVDLYCRLYYLLDIYRFYTMSFCAILSVANHFPRLEIRNLYRCLKNLRQAQHYSSVCKFSRAACDQHTQICRGGTAMIASLHVCKKVQLESVETAQKYGYEMALRKLSTSPLRGKKEEITVNFLNRDGETLTVKAKVGDSILDTVIDNDVDIDGFGACEGTLACSTCHLIFDEETYETLPEKLDEEEDMLDLAYGLTDTSRLGCQITLTKEMDNILLTVPEGISDARDV